MSSPLPKYRGLSDGELAYVIPKYFNLTEINKTGVFVSPDGETLVVNTTGFFIISVILILFYKLIVHRIIFRTYTFFYYMILIYFIHFYFCLIRKRMSISPTSWLLFQSLTLPKKPPGSSLPFDTWTM